jgi:hypothetical protein
MNGDFFMCPQAASLSFRWGLGSLFTTGHAPEILVHRFYDSKNYKMN